MHKAKNIKIKIRFPIPFRCFAALNMTIIIVLPRHSEQSEESKNCRNRCFAALNMTETEHSIDSRQNLHLQ